MSFLRVPQETPELRAKFDALCVRQPDGCLVNTSFDRAKGYPGIVLNCVLYFTHRVAYAWAYGDVDADIHHLCRNIRCCEPTHLKAPTDAEPQPKHRGPYPHLRCSRGHEFTPENTYLNPRGERQCRTCLREASRRFVEKNREAINAKRRANRVRVVYEERPCPKCGFLFTPKRSDVRYCSRQECINLRQRENRQNRLGRTSGTE